MKIRYFKGILPLLTLGLGLTACTGDLDVNPNKDPNTNTTFNEENNFNKIYATLGLTGRQGPAGMPDLVGKDEGSSGFIRVLFNSNQLPTDETICAWSDGGIGTLTTGLWDSSNDFINLLYYRLYYGIIVVNNYLENTTGVTDADGLARRAEARFIRALYYYHLLDAFGNVGTPLTISTENPTQTPRAEVFKLVEDELKEILPDLKDVKTNAYGRVDKAAAWLLLARLYLNAEVYTGTARWNDAATYAKMVMDSQYTLAPVYRNLFLGDNDSNGAQVEVLLPVLQDGVRTNSYSGSSFLVASTHVNTMTAAGLTWGTAEGWGGNRSRENLIKTFIPSAETTAQNISTEAAMVALAGDDRALFYSQGHTFGNDDVKTFTNGFANIKWSGLYSTGANGSDVKFVDTDVPLLRAAEAYLTYAEATFRANGNVSNSTVASTLNTLRTRAHAATQTAYTEQDILDEWQKEFHFEGRRRIDLIRFKRFGGYNVTYTWPWKGGTRSGSAFAATRNIYPIPTEDLNANRNLTQNPGY